VIYTTTGLVCFTGNETDPEKDAGELGDRKSVKYILSQWIQLQFDQSCNF